jgi:hypothetical protein
VISKPYPCPDTLSPPPRHIHICTHCCSKISIRQWVVFVFIFGYYCCCYLLKGGMNCESLGNIDRLVQINFLAYLIAALALSHCLFPPPLLSLFFSIKLEAYTLTVFSSPPTYFSAHHNLESTPTIALKLLSIHFSTIS